MDTETPKLLSEIKAFLRESGMSATYFGKQAVGNSEVVRRLETGGTVTLITAQRMRDYIANPEERRRAYQSYTAARKKAEKSRNGK